MSSRREEKERLRQERVERERAAAASAARRRRLGYAVAGVVVVAAIAAIAAVATSSGSSQKGSSAAASWPSGSVPKRKITDLSAAARTAGCVLKHAPVQGRQHTTGHVNYKTAPPTSGPHYPTPAHDAAYLSAPKPYETLVHALEHGRVVYWFKPSVAPAVKGALKRLYDEDRALVILTPNPRPMPYAVAATAWTQLLGCPNYNARVPDAFRAFRDAYRLKAPEYFPDAE